MLTPFQRLNSWPDIRDRSVNALCSPLLSTALVCPFPRLQSVCNVRSPRVTHVATNQQKRRERLRRPTHSGPNWPSMKSWCRLELPSLKFLSLLIQTTGSNSSHHSANRTCSVLAFTPIGDVTSLPHQRTLTTISSLGGSSITLRTKTRLSSARGTRFILNPKGSLVLIMTVAVVKVLPHRSTPVSKSDCSSSQTVLPSSVIVMSSLSPELCALRPCTVKQTALSYQRANMECMKWKTMTSSSLARDQRVTSLFKRWLKSISSTQVWPQSWVRILSERSVRHLWPLTNMSTSFLFPQSAWTREQPLWLVCHLMLLMTTLCWETFRKSRVFVSAWASNLSGFRALILFPSLTYQEWATYVLSSPSRRPKSSLTRKLTLSKKQRTCAIRRVSPRVWWRLESQPDKR